MEFNNEPCILIDSESSFQITDKTNTNTLLKKSKLEPLVLDSEEMTVGQHIRFLCTEDFDRFQASIKELKAAFEVVEDIDGSNKFSVSYAYLPQKGKPLSSQT